MIINILKDIDWIDDLEKHNDQLIEANKAMCDRYWPSVSGGWFNPLNVKMMPLSRIFPNVHDVINYRPEYKLVVTLSNYVPLFLIRELYKDRKDIQIEDIGTGNGNLIYYLAKSGFKNFDTFENFAECPKEIFDNVMSAAKATCSIDDLNINPVVIHSASAPKVGWIGPGVDKNGVCDTDFYKYKKYYGIKRDLSNLELICFYCNTDWEEKAEKILPDLGYTFLCRDTDHMGNAYCRNDKLKEFTEKLEDRKE